MAKANYLRSCEAAEFLSLSNSTLAKMRVHGNGPPYCKLGDRVVLYNIDDLINWVESRKVYSTSEYIKGVK